MVECSEGCVTRIRVIRNLKIVLAYPTGQIRKSLVLPGYGTITWWLQQPMWLFLALYFIIVDCNIVSNTFQLRLSCELLSQSDLTVDRQHILASKCQQLDIEEMSYIYVYINTILSIIVSSIYSYVCYIRLKHSSRSKTNLMMMLHDYIIYIYKMISKRKISKEELSSHQTIFSMDQEKLREARLKYFSDMV